MRSVCTLARCIIGILVPLLLLGCEQPGWKAIDSEEFLQTTRYSLKGGLPVRSTRAYEFVDSSSDVICRVGWYVVGVSAPEYAVVRAWALHDGQSNWMSIKEVNGTFKSNVIGTIQVRRLFESTCGAHLDFFPDEQVAKALRESFNSPPYEFVAP